MTASYNLLHNQVLDSNPRPDVQMHWPVTMGAVNQAAAIMCDCCRHQRHKDDSGMACTSRVSKLAHMPQLRLL